MRVLLVQQDTGRRVIRYPLFPIGLTYIATALKNHQVKIFDPNVYDYPECFKELENEARNFQPDIVGISIRNIDTANRKDPFVNFKTVKPTIQAVKRVNPNIAIMAGGTGFSIYANEIMEYLPEIDYGIYLEGEETAVDLLANLNAPERVKSIFYRKNGQVIFTGRRDLPDFSDFPITRKDPEVIDMAKYIGPLHNIIGVQSKRGCVFNCTYCSYLFLNERKLRLRNPGSVVDEIVELVDKYGVKGFTFVDSVFNIPEEHARGICHEMIKRNVNVEWGTWLTPIKLSKDFLLLLREAGCRHIGFSTDAVTDKGLRSLKKGYAVREIEESMRIARQVKGMAVGFNFFCAYPDMDLKAAVKTVTTFFKIPLLFPGRGGVGLNWIRLEPHTEIFSTAVKEGVIAKDANFLPENEDELLKLFYVPSHQRHFTLVFDFVLFMTESVMKPLAIFLFRIIGKIRGQKSLYDA
ncbi:MAG: cobalamin B12-binding domain-containing protein [Candidatus Schekmanbacteria bacterium]|nr:cobalamin B12-binding domain-containing protein [Candidatus Schekmanbacteria bacterium]